jgi:hypothetical protein
VLNNNGEADISGDLQFFNQAEVLAFSVSLGVAAHRVRGLGLPPTLAGDQGFCRYTGRFSSKKVKLTLCSEEGYVPCAQAVHSD